ncbi:MAG TPA: 50S ribosomal protein L3, partial [Candidatus Dormibacteraeota bacterium]|nr:50S ribosomal protein L3 [Candidatus Dormibacteraeota bacterium]
MKGLIARKLGMTQVFDDTGIIVPVTVLDAGPCLVVGLRTQEKDGYTATRLGYGVIAEKKSTKPRLGEFKKAGIKPVRKI